MAAAETIIETPTAMTTTMVEGRFDESADSEKNPNAYTIYIKNFGVDSDLTENSYDVGLIDEFVEKCNRIQCPAGKFVSYGGHAAKKSAAKNDDPGPIAGWVGRRAERVVHEGRPAVAVRGEFLDTSVGRDWKAMAAGRVHMQWSSTTQAKRIYNEKTGKYDVQGGEGFLPLGVDFVRKGAFETFGRLDEAARAKSLGYGESGDAGDAPDPQEASCDATTNHCKPRKQEISMPEIKNADDLRREYRDLVEMVELRAKDAGRQEAQKGFDDRLNEVNARHAEKMQEAQDKYDALTGDLSKANAAIQAAKSAKTEAEKQAQAKADEVKTLQAQVDAQAATGTLRAVLDGALKDAPNDRQVRAEMADILADGDAEKAKDLDVIATVLDEAAGDVEKAKTGLNRLVSMAKKTAKTNLDTLGEFGAATALADTDRLRNATVVADNPGATAAPKRKTLDQLVASSL